MADVQQPRQPMPPQGSDQPPASVLVVMLTMYLTALSLIATAIGLFAMHSEIRDVLEAELLGDPSFADADFAADEIAAIVTFSLQVTAAIYFLFAVFYLVLGTLGYKGKRSARILSWVLAGVSLACCGIGGIGGRVAVTSMSYLGEQYNDQISGALLEATPTWLTVSQAISLLLLIVGSMLVIILLMVPASKRYFRTQEPSHSPRPDQPPDAPH